MRKTFKKNLIISTSLVLALTINPISYANINTGNNSITDTTAYESHKKYYDIDKLKNYLYKDSNNLIKFDKIKAKNEGISNDEIFYSLEEVNRLNQLAKQNMAFITNDFKVEIYFKTDNTELRSTRGGVTKVVNGFGGIQEYYLNASDTQTLINNLKTTTKISNIVGAILGKPAAMFSALNMIQTELIKSAAKGGNGIVMILTPVRDPSLSPVPIIQVLSQW